MQELKIVAAESDNNWIVLEPVESSDDSTSHRFALEVTTELYRLLKVEAPAGVPGPAHGETTPQATDAQDQAAAEESTKTDASTPAHDEASNKPADTTQSEPGSDTKPEQPEQKTDTKDTADTKPADTPAEAKAEDKPAAPQPAPKPRRRAEVTEGKKDKPLKISVKEIQLRIRRGESIQRVAEIAGVDKERIHPLAKPILQERRLKLAQGQEALPVRSDGPLRINLKDAVEAYLVGIDVKVEQARWTAFCNQQKTWIVAVTWAADVTPAEWALQPHEKDSYLAIPHNQAARLITEPSAVGPRTHADDFSEEEEIAQRTHTPQPAPRAQAAQPRQQQHPSDKRSTDKQAPASSNHNAQTAEQAPDNVTSLKDHKQDMLIPGIENKRRRKGRHAEIPKWDDILLGGQSRRNRDKDK